MKDGASDVDGLSVGEDDNDGATDNDGPMVGGAIDGIIDGDKDNKGA